MKYMQRLPSRGHSDLFIFFNVGLWEGRLLIPPDLIFIFCFYAACILGG